MRAAHKITQIMPQFAHLASSPALSAVLTRPKYERIAREWPDASVRFCDVLVDDAATREIAAAEGVSLLPAIRVYDGEAACVVPCGPRGTGPSRSLEELRVAIEECTRCTKQPGGQQQQPDGQDELEMYATPPGDLVYAALPLATAYVLIERLGEITADLGMDPAVVTTVAEDLGI